MNYREWKESLAEERRLHVCQDCGHRVVSVEFGPEIPSECEVCDGVMDVKSARFFLGMGGYWEFEELDAGELE